MSNKRKPHKHADCIHAFADGYKIEKQQYFNNKIWWKIDENPTWNNDNIYRIYDPLREVKEAFEKGMTIQRRVPNGEWEDIKKDDTYCDLEIIEMLIAFHPNWDWRVKPNSFKIGEWVVFDGSSPFRYNQLCNDRMDLRKATKEEVLNAPNYDGTATGEEFPFKEGDWVVNKNRKDYNVIQYGINSRSTLEKDLVYASKQEIENSYFWKIQQPKEYVPFKWEDKELLRGKWIVNKTSENSFLPHAFIKKNDSDNNLLIYIGSSLLNGKRLLDDFVFLDGSPCGKLKNE